MKIQKNVINTAKKLKDEGYEVIPHLPARTIINENELEKYIGDLANESGCTKILIIGVVEIKLVIFPQQWMF